MTSSKLNHSLTMHAPKNGEYLLNVSILAIAIAYNPWGTADHRGGHFTMSVHAWDSSFQIIGQLEPVRRSGYGLH